MARNPFRIDEDLHVVPPRVVANVALSRGALIEILMGDFRFFPGVDAGRMLRSMGLPIRVGITPDRDSSIGIYWVCGCQDKPSYMTPLAMFTGAGEAILPTPRPLLDLRHYCNILLEGWLACDVFIGQCRSCGRIYWR